MSIINEALKKTEEHLQKNNATNNSLPNQFKIKPLLLYFLILAAGLLLGNFIFTLLKNKTQINNLPFPKQIQTENNNLPLESAILPSQPAEELKSTDTNFVLNGIFFSADDSYALINNQIVRENEYVDGAKVGEITTNSVELNNAGSLITLTTPR